MNKNSNHEQIPDAIRQAVVAMLRPYCPDADRQLDRLLSSAGSGDDSPAVNFLTRKQVAERLQISVPTVDRMLAAGELMAIRIRRSVRISSSEVEAFLLRGRL